MVSMCFNRGLAPMCVVVCAVLFNACGQTGGADAGFVTGALDSHCTQPDGGSLIQPTSSAVCKEVPSADAGAPEEAAVLFNAEGDDDDCKYHLKVSSTEVKRNEVVTFTLVGTNRTNSSAMTGAATAIEPFLSDTHPAPNSGTTTKESPNGTYVIGPVKFDAPGRWTVKFHFFEACTDANEESPHGHVSFYVDVP